MIVWSIHWNTLDLNAGTTICIVWTKENKSFRLRLLEISLSIDGYQWSINGLVDEWLQSSEDRRWSTSGPSLEIPWTTDSHRCDPMDYSFTLACVGWFDLITFYSHYKVFANWARTTYNTSVLEYIWCYLRFLGSTCKELLKPPQKWVFLKILWTYELLSHLPLCKIPLPTSLDSQFFRPSIISSSVCLISLSQDQILQPTSCAF